MNETTTRDSTVQPGISTFLIFIIVAVLYSTFFLPKPHTAYSVLIQDPDLMDAPVSEITSENISAARIIMISFGVFWGLFFFRRRRFRISIHGVLYWIIFGYIFWAIVSVFWTDQPEDIIKNIVIFIILCFSAFSVSQNIPLRQLPTLIFWICSLILTVGFVSEIWAGVFLISSEEYRFAGTIQYNNQARICAMLLLAAVVMAKSNHRMARVFFRLMMLVAGFFLVLTRGRATFIALIIALVIDRFFSTDRSKILTSFYVVFLISCIAFLILGDAFFPLISGGILLGRQEERFEELNGRVALWKECIGYVTDRPILGYGLKGFWTPERARAVSDSQGWRLHASHSMYIDIALDLGLIGLGVFLMMVIVAWRTACGASWSRNDVGMGFALSLLTLWLAGGVLARPVGDLGFMTYLFFVVLFSIARESVPYQDA